MKPANRTKFEMVPGSQRFEPDGTVGGGGILRWEELVTRPGFRPTVVRRALKKEVEHGREVVL